MTRVLVRWFASLWDAAAKGTGRKAALLRYAIGILAGAASLGVRLAVVPWIGVSGPCVLLYPTVLVIALALGVGPGLAAAVVGLAIAEATMIHPPGGSMSVTLIPRWGFVILGAVLVGYFGGKLRQARRVAEAEAAERARLSMKLADASERERREIASWLHDNIGQVLTALRLSLDEAVRSGRLPDRELRSVREAEETVGRLTDQIRNMTFELDSPVLRKLGLDEALDELCEHVESRFGLQCAYKSDGNVSAAAQEADGVLYDAVRELLHNIVKHAGARRAFVSVSGRDGHVRIIVEDDGKGFDPRTMENSFSRNGGFGLYRMRERIGQFGGTLQIGARESGGTRVIVAMPRGPDSSQERSG